MKTPVCLVVLSFVLPPMLITAQSMDTLWTRRYDGPAHGDDRIGGLAVDGYGNVVITGRTLSSAGNDDIVTIKYKPNGDTWWIRRYNPGETAASINSGQGVAIDRDYNAVVTGFGGFTPYYNAVTIKYGMSGDQQWLERFDGISTMDQVGNAVVIDSAGNVYVTGYCYHWNGSDADILTLKYDRNGVLQWADDYGGPDGGDDMANAIVVDRRGNVYVGGCISVVMRPGLLRSDFGTVKYDSAGNRQWVATWGIGTKVNNQICALAVDDSGNVLATGRSMTDTTQSGRYTVETIKYDSSGNQVWQKEYIGNGNTVPTVAALDDAGNFIVAGGNGSAMFVMKYTPAGGVAWTSGLSGQNNAMVIDDSNRIYITGSVLSGSQGQDIQTICYNPDGSPRWRATYDGPGHNDDIGQCVGFDAGFNTYVGGVTNDTATKFDLVVIKYQSGTVGVTEAASPVRPASLCVAPNPLRGAGVVSYSLPKSEPIRLRLYDVTGAAVATLYQGRAAAGEHRTPFDVRQARLKVTDGVYILRLDSPEGALSQKVIVEP